MALPKIQTRVVHSESKSAWNVVGTELGSKYKIARVPYITTLMPEITEREKLEAYELANFISTCFNVAYNEEKKEQLGSSIYNNSHPYDNIGPQDFPF